MPAPRPWSILLFGLVLETEGVTHLGQRFAGCLENGPDRTPFSLDGPHSIGAYCACGMHSAIGESSDYMTISPNGDYTESA